MAAKHGNLSINSDNIFPIIKKWLYSDHDIFFRELISNGCDAITKLKKLDMMGEYALPDGYKPQIQVIVNPEGRRSSPWGGRRRRIRWGRGRCSPASAFCGR